MNSLAFNPQVRRSGVERSKKGLDSEIRVTDKVSPQLREQRGLTAAGHLLMKKSVNGDEHDSIKMRMLEKELPITEVAVVEKSLLNKDEVAHDLFKDSPEALYGYRQDKLAQGGFSPGASACPSPLKNKRKKRIQKEDGGKVKADRFLGEFQGPSTLSTPVGAKQALDSEAEPAAGGEGFLAPVVSSPVGYVM